jgi:glycerol-3-phosphate dehydrogenase
MSRLLSRLGSRPYLKLATGMAVGGGTLLAMSQLKNNTTQNQKPMLPFNAGIQLEASKKGDVEENALHSLWTPPSRDKLIEQLKASVNPNEEYDLLVIGGGATGTGIALDAASRGLKVALVERDDFSSGK